MAGFFNSADNVLGLLKKTIGTATGGKVDDSVIGSIFSQMEKSHIIDDTVKIGSSGAKMTTKKVDYSAIANEIGNAIGITDMYKINDMKLIDFGKLDIDKIKQSDFFTQYTGGLQERENILNNLRKKYENSTGPRILNPSKSSVGPTAPQGYSSHGYDTSNVSDMRHNPRAMTKEEYKERSSRQRRRNNPNSQVAYEQHGQIDTTPTFAEIPEPTDGPRVVKTGRDYKVSTGFIDEDGIQVITGVETGTGLTGTIDERINKKLKQKKLQHKSDRADAMNAAAQEAEAKYPGDSARARRAYKKFIDKKMAKWDAAHPIQSNQAMRADIYDEKGNFIPNSKDVANAQGVVDNATGKDGIGLWGKAWGFAKNHPAIATGAAVGAVWGISELTEEDDF